MDIEFKCSGCGQDLVVDRTGCGMSVSCPACGAEIVVPNSKRKMHWGMAAFLTLLGITVVACWVKIHHWKKPIPKAASEIALVANAESVRIEEKRVKMAKAIEKTEALREAVESKAREVADLEREKAAQAFQKEREFPLESANKKAPEAYQETGDVRLYGKIVSDSESVFCLASPLREGLESLQTLDNGWMALNASLDKWEGETIQQAVKAEGAKIEKAIEEMRYSKKVDAVLHGDGGIDAGWQREAQLRDALMAKYVAQNGKIPDSQMEYMSPETKLAYANVVHPVPMVDSMDTTGYRQELSQAKQSAKDQAELTCFRYRKAFRQKANLEIDKGIEGGVLLRILSDTRVRVMETFDNYAKIEVMEGMHRDKVVYVLAKSLLVK